MAITNYSELKTAVANWLHRTDQTDVIPDYITLAEAKFNREFRLRAMEVRATATADSQYMDLPSSSDTGLTDYLEMRNIQLNISSTQVASLEYMAPEVIDLTYGNTSGQPKVYSIVGNQIQLAPIPSTGYTIELDYYAKFAALSDSTTNWLFTNAPDLYLYGALVEAALNLKDDAALARWAPLYSQLMDHIKIQDDRSKWSGSTLTQRAV